jgi:hypothetical protein
MQFPNPDPAPHQSDANQGTIGLQTIHGFILSLHASILSVYGRSPLLHFEPPRLQNFDFDVDPDPA